MESRRYWLWVLTGPVVNPSKHGGGGSVGPFLPCLLPFTQYILRQPIPENFWHCKPFCCGCPYEKKNKKFSFTPSKSTLKTRSRNRPCLRGLSTNSRIKKPSTVASMQRSTYNTRFSSLWFRIRFISNAIAKSKLLKVKQKGSFFQCFVIIP